MEFFGSPQSQREEQLSPAGICLRFSAHPSQANILAALVQGHHKDGESPSRGRAHTDSRSHRHTLLLRFLVFPITDTATGSD